MKKLIIGLVLALLVLMIPATALAGNGNRAPKAPVKIVKPVKPSGWPTGQPMPDWSWLPPGFCHTW